LGAVLMLLSGIGWGLYSLNGRGKGDPTYQTSGNFIRAAVFCLILLPFMSRFFPESAATRQGVILALLSGIVTSGLGYVIWYMALKHLKAIQAGLAQLTVPVIAAIGGIIFISEPLTWRFSLTAMVILGGVGLATLTPQNE